jgi:protein tyrosine/serine phosphatase
VSTSRWLDLEGVVNMRDVGGIPTADGGTIAPRRLLRSDNLQELSEASVRHLVDEVGVTDIIDLRTEVEVHLEGAGPLRAQPLTHHHHSLIREAPREQADPGDTAAQALVVPWSKRSGRPAPPKRDDDFWASHYLGYLADRPESVSAALHAVAGSTGAAIVHCAAGKDRTGTVVGLALSVAGVADDDIVADYVATGERLDAIVERLLSRPTYSEALRDQPRTHQLPRPETMQRILTVLRERHGGAAGWLGEQGWSDAQVARLRDKLLA